MRFDTRSARRRYCMLRIHGEGTGNLARLSVPKLMKEDGMDHRSHARHGAVAQALHWVTAILVLVAFIYGPGGSEQRVYSAARDVDRRLHETLGLCVLALV